MEAPSNARSSQALSLADAYERIRRWYQENAGKNTDTRDEYRRRSFDLISALPPREQASLLEKHGLKSVNWCADVQLFEFLRATDNSNGPLLKALDQGVW